MQAVGPRGRPLGDLPVQLGVARAEDHGVAAPDVPGKQRDS